MSKTDGPSKRLRQTIANRRRHMAEPLPAVPEVFEGISIPPNGHFSYSWWPVRDAFRAFGLDPRNPHDWEILIHDLADAHFGKRSKPKIWNEGKLCQLVADFTRAKRSHPRKRDMDICKLLVTEKAPGRYRKLDHNTLRRLLPQARKELAEAVELFAKIAEDNRDPHPPFAPRPWSSAPIDKRVVEDWIIEQYAAYTGDLFTPSWDLDGVDGLIARLRGN
jgi:hypothetical protein